MLQFSNTERKNVFVTCTPSDVPVIGIDMGVNNLVALSAGEAVKGRKRDIKRQKSLQKKLGVEVKKDNGMQTLEHIKKLLRNTKFGKISTKI